jgi:hypothetical protein
MRLPQVTIDLTQKSELLTRLWQLDRTPAELSKLNT